MKKELIDNINWTAYRKDVEGTIRNERLWMMGAGEDASIHEDNIKELTEELENIIEGNYQMVIDKYENLMGEEETVRVFSDFFIEDPEKIMLQSENQRNELFLDALTDIALQTGWEHVEFEDSKTRSITLRSWANEFADKYAGTDWEKLDYISTVDDFATKKLDAWLHRQPELLNPQEQKERISDIHIYSGRDAKTYIRCKIDGEQQMGRKLSFADVCSFNDRTDRMELAVRYFKDVLEPEQTREQGMKR